MQKLTLVLMIITDIIDFVKWWKIHEQAIDIW